MCVNICVYMGLFAHIYTMPWRTFAGNKMKATNESAFHHLVYFFLSFLCLNTVFSPFVQDVRFVISENVSKF